ncbi:MAG: hypothetical protein JW797_06015 [Bradymonadales bacterium]|nr:hypothetical protein [Bradymonadales bacterium]
MDETIIRKLLEAVRDRETTVDEAVGRLRNLPYQDLGFARVDHHRALRLGFPEVVFGQGKTPDQLAQIVTAQIATGSTVLVTRVTAEVADEIQARLHCAGLRYNQLARCLVYHPGAAEAERRAHAPIAVLSGGTSDIPVAEEAAVTAEVMGNEIVRLCCRSDRGQHRHGFGAGYAAALINPETNLQQGGVAGSAG